MSKRIYKYPLQVTDEQEIRAPIGMKPLSVQVQNGRPFLWALVDPGAGDVMHSVYVHGTGHELAGNYADRFVGTFQLEGGAFVGHVFCVAI